MKFDEMVAELEQVRGQLDEMLQDLPHAVLDERGVQMYVYGVVGVLIGRLDALSGRIAADCGIEGHQPWAEQVTQQALKKLQELDTQERRAGHKRRGFAVD